MGVNIELYFKALPNSRWDKAKTTLGDVQPNDDEEFTEPTHYISSLTRLYDFYYERGPWPEIAAIIMELLADPKVTKVWYDGDSGLPEDTSEMTEQRFFEITKHYLKNMHEPYNKAFR